MTTSGRKTDLAGLSAQIQWTPDDELDELIRRGWGSVDRHKIPSNWRDLPPRKSADGSRWPKDHGPQSNTKPALTKAQKLEAHAASMRKANAKDGRGKANFTRDLNQERRRAAYLRAVGRSEPEV